MKVQPHVITHATSTQDAVRALKPLSGKELLALGAAVFADSNNRGGVPGLSSSAAALHKIAAGLMPSQREALVKGFTGAPTADVDAASNLGYVAQRVHERPDGSVAVDLQAKRSGRLLSSDHDTLRAAFAGRRVVVGHEHGVAIASATGAREAKPLTAPRKAALLVELHKRFDGVRDVEVKRGVLSISAGNAFDKDSGAVGRLVAKFVGDVPWVVQRDSRNDAPLYEVSAEGVVTGRLDGATRVPLFTHEQGLKARAALKDDRIWSIHPDIHGRHLSIGLAPWVSKAEGKAAMKQAAKALGADAVVAYVSSGVVFGYGAKPNDAKPVTMFAAEAGVATARARKIDPDVEAVGPGTYSPDLDMRSGHMGGEGRGNAVTVFVGGRFDPDHADGVVDAVLKALGLPQKTAVVIDRRTSGELASMGVKERKDSYAGLRDAD